jgi:hypothetical protein
MWGETSYRIIKDYNRFGNVEIKTVYYVNEGGNEIGWCRYQKYSHANIWTYDVHMGEEYLARWSIKGKARRFFFDYEEAWIYLMDKLLERITTAKPGVPITAWRDALVKLELQRPYGQIRIDYGNIQTIWSHHERGGYTNLSQGTAFKSS